MSSLQGLLHGIEAGWFLVVVTGFVEDDIITHYCGWWSLQGLLQRHREYLIEDDIITSRERHLAEMQRRVHAVKNPPLVWVKHTATGHSFAPDYVPLPPAAMAKLVLEMRVVYQQAAAQQVGLSRGRWQVGLGRGRAGRSSALDCHAVISCRWGTHTGRKGFGVHTMGCMFVCVGVRWRLD